MLRRVLALLGVAAALASCASEPAAGTSDEDLRAARCERDFAAPLRAKVDKARALLDRSTSAYADTLRRALDERRVKVHPFCEFTRSDFEHLADDTDLSAGGATREEQFKRLRAGDEKIMRSLHAQLFGYEWEDRVYLASTMSADKTLETLAHETQHVLRQAHVRNFEDQRVTCVEELAAARAEQLVHKDVLTDQEERETMDRVHDLYELDKLAPGKCSYR